MSLSNRARKNAFPLLELPQKSIYYLFERAHEIDQKLIERISELSNIYANDYPDEIPILREITDKMIKDSFEKWRYSHDKAEGQLAVLGGKFESWKKNMSKIKVAGESRICVRESDNILDLLELIRVDDENIECLPSYVA